MEPSTSSNDIIGSSSLENENQDFQGEHDWERARRPNVIIDPVTRIEGHLRIQATADPIKHEEGRKHKGDMKKRFLIKKPALSSSTMVRGFEIIMKDRDPREAWAFAQRICGVCTVVHGLTSVRAVENAVGLKVPRNADYIRNLMIGAQYVHDHVMHFYHLHALDWVDVVSALCANPKKTAELAAQNNPNHTPNNGKLPDEKYFRDIILKPLKDLVARKQLGLFSNGYWGHPAYQLSPEQNLLLVSHYLEALTWAPDAVLIHAVCGGKDPHPDLLVGGMQYPFSDTKFNKPYKLPNGYSDPDPNKPSWQIIIEGSIKRMQYFVDNVYLPDIVLAATAYKDWANYGATAGNFLCFGDFPDPDLVKPENEFEDSAIEHTEGFVIPQGVIWKNDITKLEKFDPNLVTENVTHAWYDYKSGVNLHPYVGETELNYTGPAPDKPGYMLDEHKKYTWMKSPRYDGKPVEVGPLAHVLMMHARNTLPTDSTVRDIVSKYWTGALGLPYHKLNSTLGRIFCRALETKIIGDKLEKWKDGLVENKDGHYYNPKTERRLKNPDKWPNPGQGFALGFGYTEAPRGALGHWVKIRDGSDSDPKKHFKIDNYQCIVASLWNAGPRDDNDVPGPYEQSLRGHFLHDPSQPLEVLRTIHSFDPCIGCAVHIVDPNGEPLVQVKVNHTYRSTP